MPENSRSKHSPKFIFALQYTLKNEGGFSNHPADRGGATNKGITLATYSRFLGRPASVKELREISESTIQDIYFKFYYSPLGLDAITSVAIITALFDIGVVRGISVPGRYAQQVANKIRQSPQLVIDGHIGPKTVTALNEIDAAEFIPKYHAFVELGFRAIVANRPSQKVFLNGWLNRARRLLTLVPKQTV